MQNKRRAITQLYESILADKNTFNMLKQALGKQSRLDEKFITEHILPLAQKFDPEITWQDIFNYEKEALNQPTSLNLSDLENISGGKASNVLLSCGLLALMGFAGGSAANTASADFIPFTQTKEYQDYEAFVAKGDSATEEEKTKYENTTLGEVPFYQQADHLVDGLLWFYNPSNNTAFFVLDRTFNDAKEAVYTYSSDKPSSFEWGDSKPSFDKIKAKEFSLLNVDELDGYLKASFNDANTVPFSKEAHNDSQTVQLTDDNPLYNYARFYNPNFNFNYDLPYSEHQNRKNLYVVNMYASLPEHTSSIAEGSAVAAFQRIHWCKKIEDDSEAKALAEETKQIMLGKSWSIAHRTTSGTKPSFDEIESLKNLKTKIGHKGVNHTNQSDIKLIRNDGFTFWTLQPDPSKKNFPSFFMFGEELFENTMDFSNISLVSCSIDLQYSLLNNQATACFNGSSEEVKEQVITYYINKFCEKNGLEQFKKLTAEEITQSCTNMIHTDELEVRIPIHRKVNNWEKVFALESGSKSMPTIVLNGLNLNEIGQFFENYTEDGSWNSIDQGFERSAEDGSWDSIDQGFERSAKDCSRNVPYDEDQESISSEDSDDWIYDEAEVDEKNIQQENLNQLIVENWEDFDDLIE